jgi:hypothetical protein
MPPGWAGYFFLAAFFAFLTAFFAFLAGAAFLAAFLTAFLTAFLAALLSASPSPLLPQFLGDRHHLLLVFRHRPHGLAEQTRPADSLVRLHHIP